MRTAVFQSRCIKFFLNLGLFKYFSYRVQGANMHQHAKFYRNRSNRGQDMVIFQLSKMAAAAILDKMAAAAILDF